MKNIVRKVLASKWILPFWNVLGRKTQPKPDTMMLFYIFVAIVVSWFV